MDPNVTISEHPPSFLKLLDAAFKSDLWLY